MTNDDDMMIRETAREICAKRWEIEDAPDTAEAFRSGKFDYHPHIEIAEAGVRAGIKLGRML